MKKWKQAMPGLRFALVWVVFAIISVDRYLQRVRNSAFHSFLQLGCQEASFKAVVHWEG